MEKSIRKAISEIAEELFDMLGKGEAPVSTHLSCAKNLAPAGPACPARLPSNDCSLYAALASGERALCSGRCSS